MLSAVGCSDDDARAYAAKLGIVLKAYQEQVDAKIKAEQASYKALTAAYSRAKDDDAIESLWLKRAELAETITDRLLRTRTVTLTEIHAMLRRYANLDFEISKTLLEREIGDTATQAVTLASLELEGKKIAALAKALEDLSQPKGALKELKTLATYAGQVETEYNKLVCDDLTKQSTDLADQIKTLVASGGATLTINGLKSTKDQVDKSVKEKGCSTDKKGS
jgi:hypothetical protein